MLTPTALDAMARWLVLTLAGLGLFALVSATSDAAPGFASTRWVFELHPVQFVAILMIVVAWVLFVARMMLLRRVWAGDPRSVALGFLSVGAVAACVISLGWVPPSMIVTATAMVSAVVLTGAFCVRVDRLARSSATRPWDTATLDGPAVRPNDPGRAPGTTRS